MSEITVAFFGSHPLGERCLELLTDHDDVSVELVVTYPPEADNWWDGDLYSTALNLGHDAFPIAEERSVLEYDVDYLVSVYYPNIFGPELLDHPNEAPVNLHQAELPRYQGSNVFSHSILNAREDDHWRHGTTLHVMAEQVDAGDVIDRRFATIEETDTARSLYETVCERSVELFRDNLPVLVDRRVDEVRTPQSEFEGERYFYRKSSLDGTKEIPLSEVAEGGPEVYDRIRALDFPPHEPAYTRVEGEKVYLTLTGYEAF